jgi:hypothetical protein
MAQIKFPRRCLAKWEISHDFAANGLVGVSSFGHAEAGGAAACARRRHCEDRLYCPASNSPDRAGRRQRGSDVGHDLPRTGYEPQAKPAGATGV